MNLLKNYQETIKECLKLDEYRKALDGKISSSLKTYNGVTPFSHEGKIYLFDCVVEYYYPKDITPTKQKSFKKNRCYDVRKQLNVTGELECTHCHRSCLSKCQNNEISLNKERLFLDLWN